jgi:ribosomal protein S18 acetylase RimI-like enzyme
MTGPARVFEIRPARPQEYEAIGELCVIAYAALEGETDLGYFDELRNVAGRAALVDVLVAAEPRGPLLGTVTYVPGPGPLSESERDDEAGFRMLAVAPWSQGRGVGRALVEACIERARADGRAGLAIYTRPSMRMAQRLYESLGFQRDKASDWEYEPGEWLWGYRLRF